MQKATIPTADSHPGPDTGHDKKGRFKPGNKCSRGRKVTELRRTLLDVVTPEDIRAIVAAVVEKAKEGDLQAISILRDRCIGRPMSVQEFELTCHEYDREDFNPSPFAMIESNDQIRPLRLKG